MWQSSSIFEFLSLAWGISPVTKSKLAFLVIRPEIHRSMIENWESRGAQNSSSLEETLELSSFGRTAGSGDLLSNPFIYQRKHEWIEWATQCRKVAAVISSLKQCLYCSMCFFWLSNTPCQTLSLLESPWGIIYRLINLLSDSILMFVTKSSVWCECLHTIVQLFLDSWQFFQFLCFSVSVITF